MGMKSLLIVACLILATAAQGPDGNLIRCKHELCPKLCEFGQQTDEHGCYICECLDDPCKGWPCKNFDDCVMNRKCNQHPCKKLDYECIAKENPIPCPVPLCMDFCPHGLGRNEHGCETCDCKKNACDDVICPENQECHTVKKPHPWPHVDFSYHPACAPSAQPPMDLTDILTNYEKLPPLCPFRKAALAEGRPELLAHQHLEEQQLLMRSADDVACDPLGNFSPHQCNTRLNMCWCETDAGAFIPDSLVKGTSADKFSGCVPHVTTAVDIKLTLTHNVPGSNMPAEDQISVAVKTQLNELLTIDSELIEIKQVRNEEENVFVSVTLHSDGRDGSESVAYVYEWLRWSLITGKKELLVQVEEHTFSPDLDSLEMTPYAEPASGDTESWCHSQLLRKPHLLVLLAGLLSFLLLVLIWILVVLRVRRRKKRGSMNMQHYNKNLAFSSEWFQKKPKDDIEVLVSDSPPPSPSSKA